MREATTAAMHEGKGRILGAPARQAILREAPGKPCEGKGTDAPPGNCEKPDGGRDTGHCELELDEDWLYQAVLPFEVVKGSAMSMQ